jgi:hypothetical protein
MKRTNLSNIQNLVEAELMLKPTFKTLPVVITKLVACSHETIKLFQSHSTTIFEIVICLFDEFSRRNKNNL